MNEGPGWAVGVNVVSECFMKSAEIMMLGIISLHGHQPKATFFQGFALRHIMFVATIERMGQHRGAMQDKIPQGLPAL
eukprot:1155083-Pelagomonas_calceolata.AAC.1